VVNLSPHEFLDRLADLVPPPSSACSKAVGHGWTMASEGVLATLRAGWDALAGIPAPKALIGGLALTAWNHARYTRDADVLVAIAEDEIDHLVAVLVTAGFHRRHSPPLRAIKEQGLLEDYRAIWIDAYPGQPVPDLL
jgi:hypothetical protein